MESSSSQPLIDLRDVVKTYETGAGGVTVLKDIDLRVKEGEFVGVVGPSGSGKSTLLNMITGIDRPTSGEVYVGGEAVHKLSENQLARWRGKSVGVTFQFFQLLPSALSGGEQQRAAIARALANAPPVVVADEPTGNLDTHTAAEEFVLFDRLVDEGKTLLVVSHDRDLGQQTRRVIHLVDGRIHRDQDNSLG